MKSLNFFTILLFVFLAFCANGQSSEYHSNKRFSIGILFSPDYSYRTIKVKSNGYFIHEYRNEMEKPKFGHTTGLTFHYKLNKYIALESGVQFSEKGEKMVIRKIDFYSDENDNFWIENDPAIPEKFTNIYNYHYVDIPLKLNWYFINRDFRFFLSAGISSNIFLNAQLKGIYEFDDRTEEHSNDIDIDWKNINWAAVAGVGFEYNFPNQIGIRLEPVFRHSFTPIANTPLKEFPFSFGLNIALFCNI